MFEILGREDEDFALGYEEGEFVFCFRCEGAELDAGDDGACGRGQMLDVGVRGEMGEGWISVFGVLVVLERFEWGVDMVGGPAGNVLGVLHSRFSRVEANRVITQTLASEEH